MMFDIIIIFVLAILFLDALILVLLTLSRIMPRSIVEDHGCQSCNNYETCAAVMQDCLPDFPCAYWQKKKP